MKRLIISDAHIGSTHFKRHDQLSEVLMGMQYDELIINGDFFELVRTSYTKFSKADVELVSALLYVVKQVPVVYILGNHDTNANTIEELLHSGIEFTDRYIFEDEGRKFLVMHSHQFDFWYKHFPTFYNLGIRFKDLFDKIFRCDVDSWEIYRFFMRPEKYKSPDAMIALAKAENIDVVIQGHTHLGGVWQQGSTVFVDSGCWLDRVTRTFIEHGKVVQLDFKKPA